MGTRSRIGIMNSNGSVTSIYCHWDGYTSHNGRILVHHYNTEEQVRELMALGDLSTLAPEIGRKHPFDQHNFPGGYTEHKKLYGNMCMAYGRDRGETGNEARTTHTAAAFEKLFEEYNYLFYYGRWMVRCRYATNDQWVLVTEQLERERAEKAKSAA